MGFEQPEEVNNFIECRPYQRAVESAIKKPFLLTTILFTHSYCHQLVAARNAVVDSLTTVYQLALGSTAVGTGVNTPNLFGQQVIALLAEHYQLPFVQHANLYAAVSGEDALVRYSSALKQLAAILLKIADDFRILGSDPRCGLNDWHLPANEPGNSIMPGKVNPTQCEALSMVCLPVFGMI